MSEITPSRKTGRPKGYIANYQPQTKTLALLDAVDMVLNTGNTGRSRSAMSFIGWSAPTVIRRMSRFTRS